MESTCSINDTVRIHSSNISSHRTLASYLHNSMFKYLPCCTSFTCWISFFIVCGRSIQNFLVGPPPLGGGMGLESSCQVSTWCTLRDMSPSLDSLSFASRGSWYWDTTVASYNYTPQYKIASKTCIATNLWRHCISHAYAFPIHSPSIVYAAIDAHV